MLLKELVLHSTMYVEKANIKITSHIQSVLTIWLY